MRWPRASASRRRSPVPGSCQRETRLARSGRWSRNQSMRRAEAPAACPAARARSSRPPAAGSARPASAPSASGPRRRVAAARRRRTRPRSSHSGMPMPPRLFSAAAMNRKCSKNLVATSSYAVVLARQLEGDGQHVQAEHAHPGGAVGLLEVAAGRQRRAAVEDADVVQPEEAALEDVAAVGVLAVDPPGEVEQQLVEDAFEEATVGDAGGSGGRSCRPARRPRRGPAG